MENSCVFVHFDAKFGTAIAARAMAPMHQGDGGSPTGKNKMNRLFNQPRIDAAKLLKCPEAMTERLSQIRAPLIAPLTTGSP
ncbi:MULTISPECIES: hypothetical protein [Burkholderia]|uniref:hypothetical protein n=1 Tax=Burkholderia TaxID=32008 RepID=UPI0012E3C841|nr:MULTISPECIES: hypothetical protein [Burkholderia]